MPQPTGISRRAFAAGALAAPALLQGRPSEKIGVGIIGVGVRGIELLEQVIGLENVELRAISDLYTGHVARAVERSKNPKIESHRDYHGLLARKDIDAVVIATPDHWHARMAVDAAEAGKDIYLEKCMTRTIPEAKKVWKAVKDHKRVFQLGHGGRSSESTLKAREIIESGALGKITYVRTWRHRNTLEAQWRWYSSYSNFQKPADADPEHIDWERFLGPAPKRPFDASRFFHWRCYWDYGTGIAGDLVSHELDTVNAVLRMGFPRSCVASGGLYYWKDGREVPDVFSAVYEYPERDLSISFGCQFNNSHGGEGGAIFYGKDGTLELARGLRVYAEPISPRAAEIAKSFGAAAPRQGEAPRPVFEFARRGAGGGSSHMQNWIDNIRTRGRCRCNEDDALEEAVISLASVISYQEGKKVIWNAKEQRVET